MNNRTADALTIEKAKKLSEAGTLTLRQLRAILPDTKDAKTPKVDRSGAYAARKVARDIVLAGYADKCEIQIAYAIGVADPVSVHVETFSTEYQSPDFIEQFVRENYDLTPKGIINSLGLLDTDYNEVSAYGHFGKPGIVWER